MSDLSKQQLFTRVAESWYGVEEYPSNISRIRELHIDPYASGDIWIVSGSTRDLIFDTGTGIVSPAAFVSSLSDKPKIAVASCYYYDHAGGLYAFEERACHRLESELVNSPPIPNTFLPITEDELLQLPYPHFKVEQYHQQGCEPTVIIEDGDIIDLGNRKLEVIHIPGRTPGSIALFEHETGFLFGGETAFIDPENRDFPPEDTEGYIHSLTRLAELPAKKVFGGHYGVFHHRYLKELAKKEVGRYS